MAAYLSTTIKLKDPEAFMAYATRARETVLAHSGEIVLVGKLTGALVGAPDHQFEALFRFADRAKLDAWYASPEYQALIPQRDAGADVVFKVLEEM